jgi:hypothetical protein
MIAALPNAPWTTWLRPGDAELAASIREQCVPLSDLCAVDTGLVAHGPDGGKARLYRPGPGNGIVPFADARDFFRGEHRWMDYAQKRMHRPKRPELFEPPKLVVQRLKGRGPVRAAIDLDGIYVGHTCLVAVPTVANRVPLSLLLKAVMSPLLLAVHRIEQGDRLDLYPRDLARWPIPAKWLETATAPLEACLELPEPAMRRLRDIAAVTST